MEYEDSLLHCGQHAISSSGSNHLKAGNSSANNGAQTPSNVNDGIAAPLVAMQEMYQYMPITNVTRIMRRVLPPHTRISDDAKEMVQECLSEYISFITDEANEHCHLECQKTVIAEDLLWAMEKMGFDDYVEPLTIFLHRYRHSEGNHSTLHSEPVPITVRQNIDNYRTGPTTEMPPPTLSPPFASYGSDSPLDPSKNIGMFDPIRVDRFNRDGSSAGTSSNAMANFDRCAHLKRDRM